MSKISVQSKWQEPNKEYYTTEFVAVHKAVAEMMYSYKKSGGQKLSVTVEVEGGKKARITFEELTGYDEQKVGD